MPKRLRIVSQTIRLNDHVKDYNGLAIPEYEKTEQDDQPVTIYRVIKIDFENMEVEVEQISVNVWTNEKTNPPDERQGRFLPQTVRMSLSELGIDPERENLHIAFCPQMIREGEPVRITEQGRKAAYAQFDVDGDYYVSSIIKRSKRFYGVWVVIKPCEKIRQPAENDDSLNIFVEFDIEDDDDEE